MENCGIYRIKMVKEKNIEYRAEASNSQQAIEVIKKTITEYGQSDREQMVVLMVNAKNKILGTNIVAIGSLSSTIICLRERCLSQYFWQTVRP